MHPPWYLSSLRFRNLTLPRKTNDGPPFTDTEYLSLGNTGYETLIWRTSDQLMFSCSQVRRVHKSVDDCFDESWWLGADGASAGIVRPFEKQTESKKSPRYEASSSARAIWRRIRRLQCCVECRFRKWSGRHQLTDLPERFMAPIRDIPREEGMPVWHGYQDVLLVKGCRKLARPREFGSLQETQFNMFCTGCEEARTAAACQS